MATRPVGRGLPQQGPLTLAYNPYQAAFHAARRQRLPSGKRAFHRLSLFAGRRGGKTLAGAMAAVDEAATPNTIGWACAPSYPQLHDYVIPTFFRVCPPTWVQTWSEKHLELRLKNGSLVQFRSLDDPDRARGPGLHWAWIDEACQVAQRAWDTLRPSLTEYRGVAWFTTTPLGFDWCYKRFWVPAMTGIGGFWAAKYKTADNPIIDADELAEARGTMDALWYRQEYEADFVQFLGSVFGDLLEPCLLRTDDAIRRLWPTYPVLPADWSLFGGIDPGADHPFAHVLFARSPHGLIGIGEHLLRTAAVTTHVAHLKGLWGGRVVSPIGIDRSALQIQIELAQHGITTVQSENNVVAGIQRLMTWMSAKQFWLIERSLPRTIEQFSSYRWADNTKQSGELGVERVFKLDDDLVDAARYAVMTWPELPDSPLVSSHRSLADLDPKTRDEILRCRRLDRVPDGEETDWATLDPVVLDADGAYHPLGDMYA